jgi:ribosomal protein L11 methyltransferase
MIRAGYDMSFSKCEWFVLEVFTAGYPAESVADFCCAHQSEAVILHERDEGKGLSAYFRAEAWNLFQPALEEYVAWLQESVPEAPVVISRSLQGKDENWALLWKNDFEPLHIGRSLIVTPPWISPDAPGKQVIIIEPAEAFGTGIHETTQGCLAFVEKAATELNQTHRPFTLLDVGCGSGIIAIAGIKLGANHAFGIDKNRAAVACAETNAMLNRVSRAVRFECRLLTEADGSWDIVAANLDPLTLKRGADRLVSFSKRFLIVSGILAEHWPSTRKLFEERGLVLRSETTRSKWGCGLFAQESV